MNKIEKVIPDNAFGSTPNGKPYTKHYGTETGPTRNIPGSAIDNAIENYPSTDIGNGKSLYYDSENNLTVITGDKDSIVSARKGEPRSNQR